MPQVHPPRARQRRVQPREVVPGHNDRHAATLHAPEALSRVGAFVAVVRDDALLARVPGAAVRAFGVAERDRGGGVAQVHQARLHDLVVHRHLVVPESRDAGVQVVDHEHGRCSPSRSFVGGGDVGASERGAGLARHGVLQLARGHHEGRDAHVAATKLDVERLPAALSAPDAEDQRHARGAQTDGASRRIFFACGSVIVIVIVIVVHEEVLRDVRGEPLQEPLGDVVRAPNEAEVPGRLAPRAQVSDDVRIHAQQVTLEERLRHAAALRVDEVLPAQRVPRLVPGRRGNARARSAAGGTPQRGRPRRPRDASRRGGAHAASHRAVGTAFSVGTFCWTELFADCETLSAGGHRACDRARTLD